MVEESPEGGLVASAVSESVFTEAEDMESLRDAVRDAVRCHFPSEDARPSVIRLHRVYEEVFAA